MFDRKASCQLQLGEVASGHILFMFGVLEIACQAYQLKDFCKGHDARKLTPQQFCEDFPLHSALSLSPLVLSLSLSLSLSPWLCMQDFSKRKIQPPLPERSPGYVRGWLGYSLRERMFLIIFDRMESPLIDFKPSSDGPCSSLVGLVRLCLGAELWMCILLQKYPEQYLGYSDKTPDIFWCFACNDSRAVS